jgi:uncharacterized membrane protein
MDPSLSKILYTMILFCLPGFFCIWALKDSYRLERFLLGSMLIAFAAFCLSMVAVVIGVLEPLINDSDTASYSLEQAKAFLPYVTFFGFIYTFMFGGVGTNAISSSLASDSSSDLDRKELEQMKEQLDNISSKVDKLEHVHWKLFISSIVFFVIGIGGSLYIWVWGQS